VRRREIKSKKEKGKGKRPSKSGRPNNVGPTKQKKGGGGKRKNQKGGGLKEENGISYRRELRPDRINSEPSEENSAPAVDERISKNHEQELRQTATNEVTSSCLEKKGSESSSFKGACVSRKKGTMRNSLLLRHVEK